MKPWLDIWERKVIFVTFERAWNLQCCHPSLATPEWIARKGYKCNEMMLVPSDIAGLSARGVRRNSRRERGSRGTRGRPPRRLHAVQAVRLLQQLRLAAPPNTCPLFIITISLSLFPSFPLSLPRQVFLFQPAFGADSLPVTTLQLQLLLAKNGLSNQHSDCFQLIWNAPIESSLWRKSNCNWVLSEKLP